MSVGAVIPVKALDRALMRLAGVLDAAARRDLQAAMLADLLDSCTAVPAISRLLVVTSDPQAAEIARAASADVVADHSPPRGINAAVARGLSLLSGRALVLMADLAAAGPADVEEVLARALDPPGATLVASRDGTGTNAMILAPADVLDPHLGPGSLRLHLEQAERLGVAVRVLASAALGLDVDTPADLACFLRAPRAGRSRRVLAGVDLPAGLTTPSG